MNLERKIALQLLFEACIKVESCADFGLLDEKLEDAYHIMQERYWELMKDE